MSHPRGDVNHPAGRRGPQTCTNHKELRRRRIKAGLTLDELAEQAGTTKSHLSRIENDRLNAAQPLLARLADVLGCEIDDLLSDDGGGDGRDAA